MFQVSSLIFGGQPGSSSQGLKYVRVGRTGLEFWGLPWLLGKIFVKEEAL